ncbi:MAG: hypothetical protein AAGB93_00255 [Planctomycetota bacterium]
MSAPALRLEPSRTTSAGADAWLLDGNDPRPWLAALADLGVPFGALELYVVPASSGDRAPVALLAVPPEGARAPAPRHGAQPLVRRGTVLLPADGRMEPPPADAERGRLFAMAVHLLHPRHGHVGFEEADRLRAVDLLAPPPLLSATWSGARPGLALPRGIGPFGAAVSAEDLARLLFEGGQDVSVEPLDGAGDRGPLRAASDVAGAAFLRLPNRFLARAALWYARRVPSTSDRPTFVDRLARWAGEVLATEGGGRRAREIRRLMALLRDDPDRGLRHAIPLGGNPFDRGRGFGEPRLGDETPDFDLEKLGGSRGIEQWAIDHAERRALEELYRERALADAAAGRHRRAAYVYARLLGDLRSAARVLEDGGYFREAARLWRDHVDEPVEAARCLERAGLFEDALAIHRDLEDHEAEARLLERVGRVEEARAAWRRVVDACLEREDAWTAARVLERSLDEPEEAARLLRAAWPTGRQPEACLDAWFELCDRRGWTGELRAWIAAERDGALVDGRSLPLLRELGKRCPALSDEATRDELADALRGAVGSALTGEVRLPMDEVRERLRAIGPTAPDDRVFAADVRRFQTAAARREGARQERPRTAPRGTIRTVSSFRLRGSFGSIQELLFLGTEHGLWVGTWTRPGHHLVIEQLDWQGRSVDDVRVTVPPPVERIVLPRWNSKGVSPLILLRSRDRLGRRVEPRGRPPISRAESIAVATPATMPEGTIDAVDAGNGELWVLHATPNRRVRLTRFDREGRSQEDVDVGVRAPSGPMRVARVGRGPVALHLEGVLRHGAAGPPFAVRLGRERFEVTSSPPGSVGRALVVSDTGVRLLADHRGLIRETLLSRSKYARAGFTRSGAIVIAHREELRVLRTRDQEAHLVARAPNVAEADLVAVVPGRQPDHFAVVRRDATVTVYSIE